MIAVAEVNQRRWLEESGEWLENVDPTHLALTSGKPVSQKFNIVSSVELDKTFFPYC